MNLTDREKERLKTLINAECDLITPVPKPKKRCQSRNQATELNVEQ